MIAMGNRMKHRTLDDMVKYFIDTLADMPIPRKYKLELTGIVVAIAYEAQKNGRTEER